jgi:dipeptidyl aminopeptidase/acylaminoacyl peptidase
VRPSRLPLAAAGLALALAAGPAPAQPPFTLEQVLAFPYALDPVAAARADRVAWVVNEAGVRNVWTAAAPGFEAARLTAYAEDDGVALGGLRLTPDGTVVVYVRGGGPNRAGEHPNPTSHPDGAEQTIWAVATDGGGAPRKLAEGAGAAISPDGTRLVFARRGKVFEVPLREPEGAAEPAAADAGAEAEGAAREPATPGAAAESGEKGAGEAAAKTPKPRELFQARGDLGALRWSPDGSRLAFASDRGDHGFIGVYDLEADAIRWLAPSVDRDGFPAWSPDGRRVAFLRVPGRRTGEKFDLTSATRFAVWVAEAGTGEGRELWSSPDEAGGFAQYYPEDALLWVGPSSAPAGSAEGAGRILFTSEHSGWLHVYSLAPDGEREPIDLTPGACEAETTAVTPDGSTLVFTSNCGDIDRRHLWRVATAGGTAAPVTAGDGIETDPVVLGGGDHLAFRRATARRPQRLAVARLDGSHTRGPLLELGPELPEGFPVDALVEPRAVTFRASDGLEIHAQLFLPPPAGGAGAAAERRPAAVFLHGGPIRQMLLGFHYSDYYARAYAMNQYLASRGIVALAVNFRTGIGYGRDFRRAPEQGPRGAAEYRDVVAAGRYLRRLPEVDPERIGLWGGSYGGYLTALGLARDSDLFAAGVDLHGVHDWTLRARELLPGGAWGITDDMMETAYHSSPVSDLTTWSSPILLVHGDDDRNVLFAQTTDLVQRLRDRGIRHEILVLPDEVHGFLRHESWLRVFRAAAQFFDRELAPD